MSSCTREVDTDEIKWVCKNQKCKVTFEIINNQPVQASRLVRISLFHRRYLSDKAYTHDLIGKKEISVALKPHEEKKIEEMVSLLLSLTVHHVTITNSELEIQN